ncbi:hypothetical protein ACLOJK_024359 [Asimina triloba]
MTGYFDLGNTYPVAADWWVSGFRFVVTHDDLGMLPWPDLEVVERLPIYRFEEGDAIVDSPWRIWVGR